MNNNWETKSHVLELIKREFSELCGLLSIDEIASNFRLMRLIEASERSLIAVRKGG